MKISLIETNRATLAGLRANLDSAIKSLEAADAELATETLNVSAMAERREALKATQGELELCEEVAERASEAQAAAQVKVFAAMGGIQQAVLDALRPASEGLVSEIEADLAKQYRPCSPRARQTALLCDRAQSFGLHLRQSTAPSRRVETAYEISAFLARLLDEGQTGWTWPQ